MLSMDPFPLPGDPTQTGDVEHALRGTIQQSSFRALPISVALASLGKGRARQIEFIASSDQSSYVD
jgi:hypothetical protein